VKDASRVWAGDPVLLLAVLTGLILRFYQITGQILGDDEWHALDAVVRLRYVDIASHFGESDYSIPLALLYKVVAKTVGLSEMSIRAPMLASGVLALLVLPLLARRYVGKVASRAFAWLLAISPLHVYFSRYARPYSITLLLSVVAVLAFFEWLAGGSRRWGWIYAGSTVAALYLHLAVLPVTLAPLLYAFVERALKGRNGEGRSLREIVALGSLVGAGLLALLSAPLIVDAGTLHKKMGTDAVSWDTVRGLVRLLTGTSHLWLAAGVVGLAVLGWASIARQRRRFALYLLFVAACQVAVPLLTRLDAIHHPIVFTRYCLPVLPLLLLCAGTGIARLDAALGRRLPFFGTGALAVVLAVLLFGVGPIPSIYRYPNNWTNHGLFQYEYDPTSPLSYARLVTARRISPFYQGLAALPAGALLIVEAPWYYPWWQNPYPYYQAVHRQRMQVGGVATQDRFVRTGEVPEGVGIHLRNVVHVGDDAELRRRHVRYVIFHKSLSEEVATRPPLIVDVSDWIRRYSEHGAPVYEDREIVVFDLGAG
jgi:hypothetical protein